EDRIHWSDIYRRDDNNHIERFWTSPIDRDARYGSHKKVYVLTSSRTFSAAEDLSYGLKQFKRATLVGETTAGGAHPVLPRRLHEHFVAIIPNARSVHPLTKTNWEGVGVEPDVRTSEKLAPMRAQVLALQSLLPIESDEVERARMRERIGELERDIAAGFGLCPRE
ncbi:MAG TPA: S41 family peptidase, partial [Albitalea sp.]|nr:S41 family peptidase [Albitalea sp.]